MDKLRNILGVFIIGIGIVFGFVHFFLIPDLFIKMTEAPRWVRLLGFGDTFESWFTLHGLVGTGLVTVIIGLGFIIIKKDK